MADVCICTLNVICQVLQLRLAADVCWYKEL